MAKIAINIELDPGRQISLETKDFRNELIKEKMQTVYDQIKLILEKME